MKRSFHHAIYYIKQGAKLIWHPQVRGWVLWPLVLNMALFVAVGIYSYSAMEGWINAWVSGLPSLLSFIAPLLRTIVVIMMGAVVMFSFALIATLLSAPFYCMIAERVAKVLKHPVPETPLTPKAIAVLLTRSLQREWQKFVYFLPRVIVLVIVSFIPVINLASPFLWGLWGAWWCSVQFVDYAADNDHSNAKECRDVLSSKKWRALSLGGLILIGMMVPIVNVVMGAIAVAAATAFWIDVRASQVVSD